MRTVSLKPGAVHDGDLILVNRQYPYRAHKRILVPAGGENADVLLERRAASMLTHIMDEICGQGQIAAVSGWRSKEEQRQIYQDCVCRNGTVFTKKYVAAAGHSEHHTGLAVDLAFNQPDIDFLRPYFPYSGICGLFRARAAQFGFVERYPQGKEEITGIAHEPWHFRYVGAPHAEIMQKMHITLEEYLCLLRQYSCGRQPLSCAVDGWDTEVFYLAADDSETVLETDGASFSISGDNISGFVVTVWRQNKS